MASRQFWTTFAPLHRCPRFKILLTWLLSLGWWIIPQSLFTGTVELLNLCASFYVKTLHWSMSCQEAFDILKNRLTEAPVFAHYYPALATIVTCDSFGYCYGRSFIASFLPDGERPVAFASRTLSAAERKCSAGERESLACVWACEHLASFSLRSWIYIENWSPGSHYLTCNQWIGAQTTSHLQMVWPASPVSFSSPV